MTMPHGETPVPVVIYDGHCAFCVAQATRLRRWVGGQARFESFRDPGVIERYPGLTAEECEQALQLVEAGGRISSGAEAVARALLLRPMLAPLARLYFVPGARQIATWAYRLVARNRFRLRGNACEGTCRLH